MLRIHDIHIIQNHNTKFVYFSNYTTNLHKLFSVKRQ